MSPQVYDALKTLFTVVGSLGAAWLLYRTQRYVRASSDRAQAEDRTTATNRLIQDHVIGYDVPVREAVLALIAEANRNRRDKGEDPIDISLPDPRDYPLFPGQPSAPHSKDA